MKMKLLLNIIFLHSILIFSCRESSKEDIQKNTKEEAVSPNSNRIDSLEILIINSKYDLDTTWDTLSFTYELEERLVQSNKLVSVEGDIIDVIKKDSTYYIKLLYKAQLFSNFDFYYTDARFYLQINKNQLNQLENRRRENHPKSLVTNYSGVFICKAKSINSYYGKVLALIGSNEQENNTNNLIIEGDLIDFYLFKE